MSSIAQRQKFRRASRPSLVAGFDPILTGAIVLLLAIGTALVYAATRDWYAANNLDPEYYYNIYLPCNFVSTKYKALIQFTSKVLIK